MWRTEGGGYRVLISSECGGRKEAARLAFQTCSKSWADETADVPRRTHRSGTSNCARTRRTSAAPT